jgi:hypothetical protein
MVKAYSGLMSLQMLLGLIFLLWNGFVGAGFPGYRLGHLAVMMVAVFVSHLSKRWKNTTDTLRHRNDLMTVALSLALVVIGVLILPQGWTHSAVFGH